MLNLLIYKFVVHALLDEQVAWQRWARTRAGFVVLTDLKF